MPDTFASGYYQHALALAEELGMRPLQARYEDLLDRSAFYLISLESVRPAGARSFGSLMVSAY